MDHRYTASDRQLGGPRILVVDDDETIRDLFTVVLEDHDYAVSTAASAEEALDVYVHDPFPVVITDIRMDGMSGIELLKQIKASHDDTQVIMITAHASVDTSLRSLREGAYDYILKPIEDPGVVVAAAERALEKVRLVVENRYLMENLKKTNNELDAANHMLREITLRDHLTGLYNRRYLGVAFATELQRSIRHKREFAVIFCDIDHFKIYNDVNGHVAGDMLLKEFSDLLIRRLRRTDIISRYGGEEFVAILPETDKKNAAILANEICKLVRQHHFTKEDSQPDGKITVSFGVSSYPEDGITEDELLTQADKALYAAKDAGRDRVHLADPKA